jgi:hypothetical protein
LLASTGLRAEVVFLANFNESADADMSLASTQATLHGGAAITTGKQGVAFAGEMASEALDIGCADPTRKAVAEYPIPVQDLRSGTLQFWIKTGFDWRTRAQQPDKSWDEHTLMRIPTEGGPHNGIRIDWYNRFGAWFHVYLYDGKHDMQFGLHERHPELAKFDLRPGVWHYVAITWTPQQGRLFIDGRLVEERTVETPLNLSLPQGPILFGSEREPANAMIDGFRLSNRVLFTGLKEIPVPTAALTAVEDEEAKKVLAVGGPGTVLYANPRKTQYAPRLAAAPVIDGDLSDTVWRTTPRVTGFTRLGMEHPYIDTQTNVQVGWDDTALYLGITCYEHRMDKLKADAHGPDSPAYGDDAIELFLGPWPDQPKEYFQLIANTGDGFFDGKGFNSKWNGEWKRAVKRGTDRWTLEIAVPFATLNAPVPQQGTMWRWNVARDRQAGGGVDMLSALAEISGGWHTPDEFDRLLFVDAMKDVAAQERDVNAAYTAAMREALADKASEAQREVAAGKRVLTRPGITDTTQAERRRIEQWVKEFSAIAAQPHTDIDMLNRTRLNFPEFELALQQYMQAANKLGFVTATPPKTLQPGIRKVDGFWYLVSEHLTAAVDPNTGILCGLYAKDGTPLARWSYDLYLIETRKANRKSDERLDEGISAKVEGDALVIVCQNPQLPGTTITKRYRLASVAGQVRSVPKSITISGDPGEQTLLSFVSRTYIDDAYREDAYYHRVKPAGTMGDPRTVFRAKEIKEPVLLHFLFNFSAAANLCAVNPHTQQGFGQYWLTANGKWVLPCGNHASKSFFTDTGWDMSWFTTFIGNTPQTGELRYHLFTGDRTAYHQEYRDLPERQAVINAVQVSQQAQRQKHHLNLGPLEGFDNPLDPKSRAGQVLPFLYGRLRSGEYSSHYAVPYNDLRHGDYPTGDEAKLYHEYGENSKTYPAVKIKEGIAAAKATYPRILSGWYHTPQNICYLSELAKEHPEWILKGKDGQPVPSGWHPLYGMGDFSPTCWDEIERRLIRQMDYFGMELMYLDFSISWPMVDWEKGVVRHSDTSYDFLIKLANDVHQRGGILHLNSVTFDGVHDLGYYEGFHSYDYAGQRWRDIADAFMIRRIYDRPGARTIPLYWHGGDQFGIRKNYRDYTNLVLSHLLMLHDCFHDPYHVHFNDSATGQTDWAANYAHAVAYHDTSAEAVGAVWQDIGVQPAWWRDDSTNLEVNTFRKGPAHLLTVLLHDQATPKPEGVYLPVLPKPAVDTAISADMRLMTCRTDRPTFIWQFQPRDPDKLPRGAGFQQQPGWDKLFTLRTCTVAPAGTVKDRLSITVAQLTPELTNLIAVTQVPAVFYSLEGKETNLLLPDLLGCSITGPVKNTKAGYDVRVQSVYPAEVLLYAPNGKAKQVLVQNVAQPFTPVVFGTTTFLKVSVPKGESTVSMVY